MTLDDLKGLLTPIPDGDGVETIEIPSLLSSDQVLAALGRYFGEDDGRKGVAIVIDGVRTGYLARNALYAVFKPRPRGPGFGGGAHGSLPGRSLFRVIALKCSVGGCSEQKLVMTFDEQDPPVCPAHPGAKMQPLV